MDKELDTKLRSAPSTLSAMEYNLATTLCCVWRTLELHSRNLDFVSDTFCLIVTEMNTWQNVREGKLYRQIQVKCGKEVIVLPLVVRIV